jgi:hypothetical protein
MPGRSLHAFERDGPQKIIDPRMQGTNRLHLALLRNTTE